MAGDGKILLLHEWHSSPAQRLWTFIKVFIKEGLIYGQWKAVFAKRGIGGNFSLPYNIRQGLLGINADFIENDLDPQHQYHSCYVAKDIRCLQWALEQKRLGRIQKLVAGPMIVNLPSDANRIIESPLIDSYLVPCEWIKNLYLTLTDSPTVNYNVWPVGIDIERWQPGPKQDRDRWLVFVKNPDPGLLTAVLRGLHAKGLTVEVLNSGSFSQDQYLAHLRRSQAVVFLSRSESQGLAMFEAWACDVPSLHWDPGEFRLMRHVYQGASSCPYLTKECGRTFSHAEDFAAALEGFDQERLRGAFQPRKYVSENFTLTSAARRLLEYL